MDFKDRYRRECLLKGTSPLHIIEVYLKDFVLNFKYFRIPVKEWIPIFSTLNSDSTLKKICVSIDDVDQHTPSSNPNHKQKLKHLPIFFEHLITHLSNNNILVELKLIGLPITSYDVIKLAEGIKNSNSLQHLSFAESTVGDEGCKFIVEVIKTKPNIVWLDLRKCGLTSGSGDVLHNLIQFQSAARENAVWKASLRQEVPNLDLMGGLRRLTLSDNILGEAVNKLISALYEDRWMKAVDLQLCNLENSHLNGFINATMKNASLIFLDVAYNDDLNSDLIKKLHDALKTNSSKHPSFLFEPIKLPSTSSFCKIHQGKSIDHGTSSGRIVKPTCYKLTPIAKTQSFKIKTPYPSENRKLLHKKNNGSNTKKAICQSSSNPRVEFLKEREMKNNAERHVIKICREMESAWARIARLEKEVEQLSKKHGNNSLVPTEFSENRSLVINKYRSENESQTQNVEACLRRLQGVLKELRFASATHLVESKISSKEMQNILDIVYAAVQEIALRLKNADSEQICRKNNDFEIQWPEKIQQSIMTKEGFLARDGITDDQWQKTSVFRNNIPITSTSNRPLALFSGPVSAMKENGYISGQCFNSETSIISNNDSKHNNSEAQTQNHATPHLYLSSKTSSSYDLSKQLENVTSYSCKNPSQMTSEKSQKKRMQTKGDTIILPVTSSGAHAVIQSQDTNLIIPTPLQYFSASDPCLPKEIFNGSPILSSEDQSRNAAERVNSLKSLRSNLENLLSQLQEKNNSSSKHLSVRMQESDSESFASTLKGNNLSSLSDANRQEAESNYSLDGFDSLSNSVQPDLEMPIIELDEVGVSNMKKNRGFSGNISCEKNTSCTSSSLNLSSIVDLLGNFSVDDIGSSTLTPP